MSKYCKLFFIVLILVAGCQSPEDPKSSSTTKDGDRLLGSAPGVTESLAQIKKSGKLPNSTTKPAPQHVLDALKFREKNRERFRPEPKPDLELLASRATGNSLSMTITGKIRNNTSRNYVYVQALFNVFDSNRNRVGSAMANINNLRPNEIWKFKAMYFGSDGQQFNLSKIEGF